MQEISPNSHTLTFPTLLICCSAAEGEGGEEEIYKGHLASAVAEQQPAHLIYHWDMGGGCGGGACGSEFTLFPSPVRANGVGTFSTRVQGKFLLGRMTPAINYKQGVDKPYKISHT